LFNARGKKLQPQQPPNQSQPHSPTESDINYLKRRSVAGVGVGAESFKKSSTDHAKSHSELIIKKKDSSSVLEPQTISAQVQLHPNESKPPKPGTFFMRLFQR